MPAIKVACTCGMEVTVRNQAAAQDAKEDHHEWAAEHARYESHNINFNPV